MVDARPRLVLHAHRSAGVIQNVDRRGATSGIGARKQSVARAEGIGDGWCCSAFDFTFESQRCLCVIGFAVGQSQQRKKVLTTVSGVLEVRAIASMRRWLLISNSHPRIYRPLQMLNPDFPVPLDACGCELGVAKAHELETDLAFRRIENQTKFEFWNRGHECGAAA